MNNKKKCNSNIIYDPSKWTKTHYVQNSHRKLATYLVRENP